MSREVHQLFQTTVNHNVNQNVSNLLSLSGKAISLKLESPRTWTELESSFTLIMLCPNKVELILKHFKVFNRVINLWLLKSGHRNKWAASWQNQQNDCAPSKESDQPGHPPSLIRIFAVRLKKSWVLSYPLSAQRRLIRLEECPGWSESSLGAKSFCWFWHEAAQMQLILRGCNRINV